MRNEFKLGYDVAEVTKNICSTKVDDTNRFLKKYRSCSINLDNQARWGRHKIGESSEAIQANLPTKCRISHRWTNNEWLVDI